MVPIHRSNKRFSNKKIGKNKNEKIFKRSGDRIHSFQQQVLALERRYDKIDAEKVQRFTDFPLSNGTQKGLKTCKYNFPTEIQKDSIGFALNGRDILGAAKTGSGKTLAFVIPVLECLFREGWTKEDGLGAMVITPVRELAYQIYEVFNKVGKNHIFSVALVIGGKDLRREKQSLNRCNIIICTPGRILQHMDENPLFDTMNLKILVLDEADRILDLGFKVTVNAIIENLPQERQTLLFSATQTKSVKDLARLSLKNPVYVSVHENAQHSTPESLNQHYIVCDAQDKMDLLWSFLSSNRKQKTLVFMASCKQVKFTYETFRLMRPGLCVLALYGDLHQLKRMKLYDEFCQRTAVVMFATDIAGRGLDFPNVDWVIQLDCPEDVNTYIHRVGRTARYKKGGEAVLVLLPTEVDSMVEQLKNAKIPILPTQVNSHRLVSIQRKMEGLLAHSVELKDSAQRAFKAYFKSIFLMKDKTVFDVTKIDSEAYAKSLGMAFAPRIRFIEKRLKNSSKSKVIYDSNDAYHKSEKNSGSIDKEDGFRMGDSGSEDEFLKVKENKHNEMDSVKHSDIDSDKEETNKVVEVRKRKHLSRIALAKRALKKKIKALVVKFDDDGNPMEGNPSKPLAPEAQELAKKMHVEGYDIEKAKLIMEKEDILDKKVHQQKIRERNREKKWKQKEQMNSKLEDSEEEGSEEDIPVDPHNMSGSEIEDEESSGIGVKRKQQTEDEDLPNKRNFSSGKDINYDSDAYLSADEDENLALHFLQNT